MPFEEYIKDGRLVKRTPDPVKAKSLLQSSARQIDEVGKFLLGRASGDIILTTSYTALRQVLEAMAIERGYHAYSHEFYTDFLKHLDEQGLAVQFDELRKLRNGVEYYGKSVSAQRAKDAFDDIERIIATLRKKYLKGSGR